MSMTSQVCRYCGNYIEKNSPLREYGACMSCSVKDNLGNMLQTVAAKFTLRKLRIMQKQQKRQLQK